MICMGRGGGGDSSWHKSGSGMYKRNSIHDFVSCANYLVKENYVHKDHLGAVGYSAGCLLLGATINMHPDLFCAAILKVSLLKQNNCHVNLVFQSGEVDCIPI